RLAPARGAGEPRRAGGPLGSRQLERHVRPAPRRARAQARRSRASRRPAPPVRDMKCPKCGTMLEDGARFCGACGSRLSPTEAAALAPAAPRAPRPSGALTAVRPPSQGQAPGDPYLGRVLNNRYRVEAKLGEGGFGTVYRGTQ